MKPTTTILILSALALTVNTSIPECNEDCAVCFPQGRACYVCTRSLFKPDGKTCDLGYDFDNKHCLTSSAAGGNPRCTACAAPYYLKDGAACEQVPQTIQNCVIYKVNNEGKVVCSVCKGGFANARGSSCVAFSQAKDAKSIQASQNCLWGTSLQGVNSCEVCQDGYGAVPSSSSGQGVCVKTVSNGCWLYNKRTNKCLGCNFVLGYSDNGVTCIKN